MKQKTAAALGLSLMMALGCLSGCGQGGQDAGSGGENAGDSSQPYGGTELTFWMQPYGTDPSIQRAAMDKITGDFEAETGIKVSYTINDWNSANQKLTLACTGGEAPDVAEELGGDDTWLTAGKDEACVDGNWYGIPWRFDTRVLLYNTEDFEAAERFR